MGQIASQTNNLKKAGQMASQSDKRKLAISHHLSLYTRTLTFWTEHFLTSTYHTFSFA
jgi:hypothetical protein